MAGYVVGGDYRKKLLIATFNKAYIRLGLGKKKPLNSETVEEYTLVDEGGQRFSNKNTFTEKRGKMMLVDVKFKDGTKALIECDARTYQTVVRACY